MIFIKAKDKKIKTTKRKLIIYASCGVIGGASVALAIALPVVLCANNNYDIKLYSVQDINDYLYKHRVSSSKKNDKPFSDDIEFSSFIKKQVSMQFLLNTFLFTLSDRGLFSIRGARILDKGYFNFVEINYSNKYFSILVD
jgi:hypothetical protein